MPIKLKLALLAGVPVIGIIVLSYMVAVDAQRRFDSVEALGTIEDLARLATLISATVDAVQDERTRAALALGRGEALHTATAAERQRVDERFSSLAEFLKNRDTSRLPTRLAEGLASAQKKYSAIAQARAALSAPDLNVDDMVAFPHDVNSDLVNATAALMGLSDDGGILRNIQALVTVLELEERASREAALLSYVFAKQAYPAGGYKVLVNLVTQQEGFNQVFRRSTSEDLIALFDAQMRGKAVDRGQQLRKIALETLDDNFGVDAAEWYQIQGEQQRIFEQLSARLNERVKQAALTKLEEAQTAVALARNVSLGVVALSLSLALIIGFGISRSVANLATAAHDVQSNQDFDVRAKKVSNDELGALTDAFNEMLGGIQKRDQELEHHRQNLEHLVDERTSELAKRNRAMRLVLDNVEQGLATIKADGTLDDERSRAFDRMFEPKPGPFYEVVASGDADARALLRLGWEGLTDGFLPTEVALSQIPSRLVRNGRHYDLAYKPIGDESLEGALMMVSDVTGQVEQLRNEAEQREIILCFDAVMRDRIGFIEFFDETDGMVQNLVTNAIADVAEQRRVIHTVKGNASIFGIYSVADVCHRIESACIDERRPMNQGERNELRCAWSSLAERVKLFFRQDDDSIELTPTELDRLIAAVRAQAPFGELEALLECLRYEPTAIRFARLGEHATRLASRMKKGELTIDIQANDLRLPRDRWSELWSSLVHVLRNALDHGLEPRAERKAAGKPELGTLTFVSKREGPNFVIELSDDGRGIDWQRIAEKAKRLKLPTATQEDLVEALFHDGLSTRDMVTELSGRGVGMGVVMQACRRLNGQIHVVSARGKGTTWRLVVPVAGNERSNTMRPDGRPSFRFTSSAPRNVSDSTTEQRG